MRVAFGSWNGGSIEPGQPADDRVEYVTEDLDASPTDSDLEVPLSVALEYVSSLNPNDVVVLVDPTRASLEDDAMAIVAALMRTKCHAMIGSSRTPSRQVPEEISDALPDLPTSRAKSRYPDASALIVGFAGAIKAVLSDHALRKTQQKWQGESGAWERYWTLAFLKSASRKKSRQYPKLALDYFEELGTSDRSNDQACFRVRPRRSHHKAIVAVGMIAGVAVVVLLGLLLLYFQRKRNVPPTTVSQVATQ
jgi:hypothetical protein